MRGTDDHRGVPVFADRQGASPAPAFDEANASYASGNYRLAITQYQAILVNDGFSVPVLFNLGNACYRDGQYGKAILNFEMRPGPSPAR